jgi:hypothetical protein
LHFLSALPQFWQALQFAMRSPTEKQPIPYVLTAFRVVVDALGHLFSNGEISGSQPIILEGVKHPSWKVQQVRFLLDIYELGHYLRLFAGYRLPVASVP